MAVAFNSSGNLATWTSAAGPSMTLNYTGSPQVLTSVTNNLDRSLTFTYTADLLTMVTDDTGRNISYAYDADDNLTSFIDTLSQTTTYSYDTPGRMTGIVYPWTSGQPFVTNTYDSLGRVKTQTNVLGATWQYFLAGTRSEEVDPYGMRHALYSTPHGKTRTEIQDLGGASQTVTTSTYDALDRLTLATAPEGNTVGYTYDLASNVLTVTRTPKPGSPLSPLVTATTYDPTFNKPLTVTDPRGLVTAMSYEPGTGNLRSVVADSATLKATTRYTYDGNGQLLTTTDPVGTVTANSYDGSGNLASTVRDSGAGRLNLTTSFTYNARGDPLTVTDPRGNVTTSTYDVARRVETTTTPATAAAPAGIVTAYTYDPAGRVTQTQQTTRGTVLRTTSATYTLSGKPATATDPSGNLTRYAYDLLDRRTSVTDAMKRVTQYGYDALSRVTQVSNPVASASPLAQQAFTANGLRASLTDANSHTTTFAYDGLDRLDTTTYPNSSTETLAYDADSNVTSRGTRAGQTIAYAYDTLNRLITKTPPSPWPTVTYSYDLAGRLKGVSDTSSSIATAVPPGGAASVEYATTYTYDALNRPVGVSWTPAPTTTAPSSASSVLFGHSYNSVNQRIGQTASDNAWIDYPSTTGTTSYTANNINQYTAVGVVTPTYDGNGNLTADGTNTLSHDPENRLVSASATGMTATYAFDGRGRRKHKTVNGTTTISVTDADNREVLEYDGSSGAILRWYAYGLGPNEVVGQMNVSAATRGTPVPDMLGSIIGMLDGGSGSLSPFGYHPYGSSSSAPSQFGYTGQRIDAESGLYYYRARHYSSKWGRFIQPDPIGYTGGSHLYGYVANDPINLIDPNGLAPTDSDFASVPQRLLDDAWSSYLAAYSAWSASVSATDRPVEAVYPIETAIGIFAGGLTGIVPRLVGAVARQFSSEPLALPGPPPGTQPAWSGMIYSQPAPAGGFTAWRVSGGRSAAEGAWLTPTQPTSASAAIRELSLPPGNTAQFVGPVRVPAGVQYQQGPAAGAFGQPGGGIQIQVLERLPSSSFGPRTPLQP